MGQGSNDELKIENDMKNEPEESGGKIDNEIHDVEGMDLVESGKMLIVIITLAATLCPR